jgi:hypothetical protein
LIGEAAGASRRCRYSPGTTVYGVRRNARLEIAIEFLSGSFALANT